MKKIKELIKGIREVYKMIIRIKTCIENENERRNMENNKRLGRHRDRRDHRKKEN